MKKSSCSVYVDYIDHAVYTISVVSSAKNVTVDHRGVTSHQVYDDEAAPDQTFFSRTARNSVRFEYVIYTHSHTCIIIHGNKAAHTRIYIVLILPRVGIFRSARAIQVGNQSARRWWIPSSPAGSVRDINNIVFCYAKTNFKIRTKAPRPRIQTSEFPRPEIRRTIKNIVYKKTFRRNFLEIIFTDIHI